MNIKPVHKTTLRGKQRTPRALLDSLQVNPLYVNIPPGGHKPKSWLLTRNMDTNVSATRSDVDAALFPASLF
jgi:hypothetical protein